MKLPAKGAVPSASLAGRHRRYTCPAYASRGLKRPLRTAVACRHQCPAAAGARRERALCGLRQLLGGSCGSCWGSEA